jgi:hypothetical protein
VNRHADQPGCWVSVAVSRAPAPRACHQAETPDLWGKALDFSPGCAGCARAALAIRRWDSQQRRQWRLTEC